MDNSKYPLDSPYYPMDNSMFFLGSPYYPMDNNQWIIVWFLLLPNEQYPMGNNMSPLAKRLKCPSTIPYLPICHWLGI